MKSPEPKPNLQLDQEESGRLFKLLVDSVTDYAIFMLDCDGHILTWNAGAERFKGYKPHEIIGKHFSVFYTKPDLDIRKPWYELEVAAEVGRFEDEGWRLRKDGTRFWANVVIIAVRDHDGTLLGFGKITRDLTERREAELRYKLLVEGVKDYAIYSLDVNGNITSWNSGAERIKGYSTKEIIGSHFSNFYTPEDRDKKMPEYVLRTAAEEGHFEGEGWRVRKDGTRFWSSVVVTPVYDEDGTLRGYSKVTRDITDRKKLMDEISKHAADLELEVKERERTNAELEAFSYSVSHDLRAPLRAIEGFSTALREDFGEQLPQAAFEYLDEISKASVRMSHLVQDLLNYSRLSRIELPVTATSVKTAVQEAVEELGIESGVLTIDVPESIFVLAHPVTLVQILANLISNALKFRDPNRDQKVQVSASPEGAFVAIHVQDCGIGIEDRHLDRIFKVFERLHGLEEYPGTGIGLAIVQRGLERMSGKITVESKRGVGSKFTVMLPIAIPERTNE
jgi:PAS domain S-box-containing protein